MLYLSKTEIILWIFSLLLYLTFYVLLFSHKFFKIKNLNSNEFGIFVFDLIIMFIPGINLLYMLFKIWRTKNYKNLLLTLKTLTFDYIKCLKK